MEPFKQMIGDSLDIRKTDFGCNLDDRVETLDTNDSEEVLKDYSIHSFYKYSLGRSMCQVLC